MEGMKKYPLLLRLISCLALCAFIVPVQAQTNNQPIPARIILGGKAVVMVADLVFAFPGVRDRVIAVAGTDQGLGTFLESVSPGFMAKPSLDKQAGPEAYAALKPDLVIMKSSMKGSTGKGLEALGIKTLYLNLETPEDYYRDLAALGRVFNQEARAEELVGYYRRITANIGDSPAAIAPGVLLVQAGAGGLETPPDSWMQSILVRMAGGNPVWKGSNPGSGWAQINPEQMALWNPEYIFVVSYKDNIDRIVAAIASDPRYANLAAVKSGKLFGFPQDFYSWDQPDTRWGLGLLWLTGIIGTDKKSPQDIESSAREFYSLFYAMNDATFDKVIKPRLGGSWN